MENLQSHWLCLSRTPKDGIQLKLWRYAESKRSCGKHFYRYSHLETWQWHICGKYFYKCPHPHRELWHKALFQTDVGEMRGWMGLPLTTTNITTLQIGRRPWSIFVQKLHKFIVDMTHYTYIYIYIWNICRSVNCSIAMITMTCKLIRWMNNQYYGVLVTFIWARFKASTSLFYPGSMGHGAGPSR